MRIVLIVPIAAVVCFGQPKSLSTVSTAAPVDFGSATSTRVVKVGTSAPGTCTVGDLFFDSDATAGSNFFGCTATNTWTLLGGSGGSSTQHAWFALGSVNLSSSDYAGVWNGSLNHVYTHSTSDPVGLASWSNAGEAGIIKWRVPATYTSGDLTFWMQFMTGDTSGGNVTFTIGTACAGDSANFNGFSFTDASPTTTAVSSSSLTTASMSVVLPMTGCSAGNAMMIRVTRSAADSHGGTVFAAIAEISGVW